MSTDEEFHTSINIPKSLVQRAKKHGVNISATSRNAIEKRLLIIENSEGVAL